MKDKDDLLLNVLGSLEECRRCVDHQFKPADLEAFIHDELKIIIVLVVTFR